MKAITIWQPWGSLIMAGVKPWEWRGYAAPRSLWGQRIVIHAGARRVRPTDIEQLLESLAGGESSLEEDNARLILERTRLDLYPLSAGLGTAVLGTPIPALEWAEKHLKAGYDSDRIDHHKWAWPLSDVVDFKPVVPCRGALGFWTWPHG